MSRSFLLIAFLAITASTSLPAAAWPWSNTRPTTPPANTGGGAVDAPEIDAAQGLAGIAALLAALALSWEVHRRRRQG